MELSPDNFDNTADERIRKKIESLTSELNEFTHANL
jgi:hypothetical protein